MKTLTKHSMNLGWRRGLPGGAGLLGVLLGAGLGLLGCQAQMNQNVGCNIDSDCPNQLHCDPTGRCVTPPAYITVTVAKLGEGDGSIVSQPAGISCGDTCAGKFAVGEPVTLTATPSLGGVVAGFSVGCNSSAATCTFTPTEKDTPVQVLVNIGLASGVAPAPAVCNPSGYCWENPRPQGQRLNRVIAVALNDEWAVGDAGTILHRTSTGFALAASGVTRNLYGIWAVTSADMYAVGEGGVILHRSPASAGAWLPETSGVATDLYDVVASGSNVYAVGAGGIILKRSGSTWAKETSPTASDLHGLVALSTGEIYGVGNSATLVRYSAGSWTTSTSAVLSGSSLNAITGATGGPLYLTSIYGEIFSYSGGVFTRVYKSNTLDVRGIALGSFGLVAVGLQGTGGVILRSSDGASWTSEAITAQSALNGVAAGPGEVVTVGDSGVMLRYDGTPWTPLSSGRIDAIRAIHELDAQHAWAVGLNGTLLQWKGAYWTPVGLTGAPPNFFGVFAVSASDAWAVGAAGAVWRWNGSLWSQQVSGTTANLRAVWAAAANKVYVVGEGGVARLWDGSTWTQVGGSNGMNLSAVGGTSASDVWAAGDGGVVLHATGGSFTAVAAGIGATVAVGGLWASAANNVWFAADTGLYRFDGTSFTRYATSATGLRAVAGAGSEVWAVGNSGALVRWNGTTWDLIDTGTKRDFYSIFLGAQKQWLGGAAGTLLSKPR